MLIQFLKVHSTYDKPVLLLALCNGGDSLHQLVSKLVEDRLVELQPRRSMEVEEGKSRLEGRQQDAIFHLQTRNAICRQLCLSTLPQASSEAHVGCSCRTKTENAYLAVVVIITIRYPNAMRRMAMKRKRMPAQGPRARAFISPSPSAGTKLLRLSMYPKAQPTDAPPACKNTRGDPLKPH
ncbi:hypothetical protein FQN60_017567 [Etheostoma spectabile]|uniref:Uncharacterized protein n=1 Tax=Etheostoma spectabile TaxID=54343 RepID=A0A5J5DFJ5_9PERO|nr:hypothetical protein FQN60_017567 [Etheostoma spectabile]